MKKRCVIGFAAMLAAALLSGCQAEAVPTETTGHEPGWEYAGDHAYYYLEDGTMATSWQEVDGKLCYFRSDGVRVTGWLSLDGKKYWIDEDGTAAAGVREIDGTAYLFNHEGMLSAGWVQVGGKRYYADEFGHPVQGWQKLGQSWYFLGDDHAAVTGWQEMDGFTYYFNIDGSAATGRLTIDGVTHDFAANGQKTLLVNPWNFVPEAYTVELADIGRGHQIAAIAVADFEEMMAACEKAGHEPVVCSSYRTHEYQQGLFERRIKRWMAEGYDEEKATELAGTSVAVPGTSEHQLGLAVDIVDNNNWALDESQADMPTQQWLMEHSWEYGWILRYPSDKSEVTGIIYEPWHYRYVGKTVAADIHETGLCLEEYLEALTK